MRRTSGREQVEGMQHPDYAEPGAVSQWSIHGWTLWHLICCADETLPFLNWSGFVSSQLSHDPLFYGSVRGGGNPLEDTALVGLLFASCCSTERMLRLKLFYAWLNSLLPFNVIPSALFSFSLYLPILTLETSHAARREEGICYIVKPQWILQRSCGWISIHFLELT